MKTAPHKVATTKPMVIFIVEPDKLMQSAYKNVISSQSREIITFRTASLAVRALEKIIPDAVILELALPGHNGFEFLYELRSYYDTRDVKVVVNSYVEETKVPWGYVSKEDLGIVAYMHKPFTKLDDIKRAVDGF